MPGLLGIFFCNKLIKFNNHTRTNDELISHTIKSTLKSRSLGVKTLIFCHYVRNVVMDVSLCYNVTMYINHKWFIDFYT